MATPADIILYDAIGSRPAAGSAGRIFYATDEDKLYRDNGSTWDELVISAGSAESIAWDDVTSKPADLVTEAIHVDLAPGDIHRAHNWEYADSTAREAATGFVSADLKKLALQLDDNSLWVLTATTPTWVQVGASSGGGITPAKFFFNPESDIYVSNSTTLTSLFDANDTTGDLEFDAGSLAAGDVFRYRFEGYFYNYSGNGNTLTFSLKAITDSSPSTLQTIAVVVDDSEYSVFVFDVLLSVSTGTSPYLRPRPYGELALYDNSSLEQHTRYVIHSNGTNLHPTETYGLELFANWTTADADCDFGSSHGFITRINA